MPNPQFAEEEQPLAPASEIINEDEDTTPAPVMPATANEFPTFQRAVDLIRTKARLARELEEADEELKRLQPLVSSYFAQHSLPRITIDHMTLFIRRDLWARPKSKGQTPEVCRVMRACDYGHFVHDTFNVHTLSAHIRDLERQNLARIDSGELAGVSALLPPQLAAVLNVSEKYTLQGRNSEKEV